MRTVAVERKQVRFVVRARLRRLAARPFAVLEDLVIQLVMDLHYV